jgi:hypothetical protein|tara:strand:- start:224 stop:490 length:267 start_codon:yes stop_codon:yes gene_type:complete
MKITKRQLRRIIKEEKARILAEQAGPEMRMDLDPEEADFAEQLAAKHGIFINLTATGSKEALLAFAKDLQGGGPSFDATAAEEGLYPV